MLAARTHSHFVNNVKVALPNKTHLKRTKKFVTPTPQLNLSFIVHSYRVMSLWSEQKKKNKLFLQKFILSVFSRLEGFCITEWEYWGWYIIKTSPYQLYQHIHSLPVLTIIQNCGMSFLNKIKWWKAHNRFRKKSVLLLERCFFIFLLFKLFW